MKISAIEQICKSAKRIELFSAQNSAAQWISDGAAFYPLHNLPSMQEQNIFALFDIPEKKQEKIRFEHKYQFPSAIRFADVTEDECALDFGTLTVGVRGMTLLPIKTSLGIVYIKDKYLKPFADAQNGIRLFERHTPGGEIYIAIKDGFLLTGIVLPCDIVTKEFVEELKTIYELSKVAIQNKPSFLGEESEPSQIGLDEFDEQ